MYDVIVLGAGAAGLFCAIEAGKRGRRVLVLEQANRVGKKILMSGGGRCNFTNYWVEPEKYVSRNPHFCKSALSRYTQWDFIKLVEKHHIPYYEKSLGQLFCVNRSSDIVDMLLSECELAGVDIALQHPIKSLQEKDGCFEVYCNQAVFRGHSCVVATGGLSIPSLGSSPVGYQIAEQFGLNVLPTRAGLVPFTLQPEDKARFSELSGVSLSCEVHCRNQSFQEQLLFTHRGLSGPAMLQISSYWHPGDNLVIQINPELNWWQIVETLKANHKTTLLKNALSTYLPKRVVMALIDVSFGDKPIKQLTDTDWETIIHCLIQWQIKPNGTEGYRTAEVTLGGVDCDAVSSKTFMARSVNNLFFIGEVLDVTGWLGGYNFQWAWSSGWAAGQYV